ncbi:MAG: J domain-containing protein, partial [Sphingobacteriales bacterium]
MIEAYPLSWPIQHPRTPEIERTRAKFGRKDNHSEYSWSTTKPLTLAQACDRVRKELNAYTRTGQTYRVHPDSVIISTNIPTNKSGLPRSGHRKPLDPGAAVYFDLDGEPYCLPCDKWDRVEDNIAAIAAHIGAMRSIERWGVGTAHNAFTDFKALPEEASSTTDAWSVLGLQGKPGTFQEVK